MARFNILYDGEVIHSNLSHEQAMEKLQDMSEKYYESSSEGKEVFDANLIKMEDADGAKTANSWKNRCNSQREVVTIRCKHFNCLSIATFIV